MRQGRPTSHGRPALRYSTRYSEGASLSMPYRPAVALPANRRLPAWPAG